MKLINMFVVYAFMKKNIYCIIEIKRKLKTFFFKFKYVYWYSLKNKIFQTIYSV